MMFSRANGVPVTALDDAFVKVSFSDQDASGLTDHQSKELSEWIENSTAKHSQPYLFLADMLRKQHPGQSMVVTEDLYGMNIIGYPDATTMPLKPNEMLTEVFYIPMNRQPGVLVDDVQYGCFRTAWSKYEFTIYIFKWREGYSRNGVQFILADSGEESIRSLLRSVGTWTNALHDEIWVFENGFWRKDHGLWVEVQKANWEDVILKPSFKQTFRKDVSSFFDSEDLYKKLGIAWKRGIIMYGPPGNGKTISLKAIMKDVGARGFSPLYVKSFQSWRGEEGSMAEVFGRARELAPCVIILEDLDSLINDRNRSFFLNQLDGIEGNDGLLIIGTTNHFDRLDPGLSERPSRFDRKYNFDDPDQQERLLYVTYWQSKLADNKDIDFPESLVTDITTSTDGFSFAYLKEVFVSSLVLFVSDSNRDDFATIVKTQIKALRKQLDSKGSFWVLKQTTRSDRATVENHFSTSALPSKPEAKAYTSSLLHRARGNDGKIFVV